MADALGVAVIEIQPDLSQFQASLARGLQNAVQQAQKSAQISLNVNLNTKSTTDVAKSFSAIQDQSSGLSADLKVINATLNQVSGNVNNAAKSIQQASAAMQQLAANSSSAGKEASGLSKVFETIGSLARFASNITNVIANVTAIATFGKGIGAVVDRFQALNAATDNSSGKIRNLGKALVETFVSAEDANKIFNQFGNLVKGAGTAADVSGNLLQKASGKTRVQADATNLVADATKNATQQLGLFDAAQTRSASTSKSGTALSNGIVAGSAASKKALKEVQDAATGAGNEVAAIGAKAQETQGGGGFIDALKEKFNQFKIAVEKAGGGISGFVSVLVEGLKGGLSNITDKVSGFLTSLRGIADGLGTLGKVGGALGSASSKVSGFISKGVEGLKGFATSAGGAELAAAGLATGGIALAGVVGSQLVGQLSNFVQQGIAAAATIQTLQISLKGIFQSTDAEAKQTFGDIQKFSALTPFTLETATNSVIKLKASFQSFTAKDALSVLKDISSAAAATGGDVDSAVSRGVLAITQIGARGKLSAQDLQQFADAIPSVSRIKVFDEIAKSLGKTREEVQKLAETGGIQASDAINGILQASRNVPGAADALLKQSKTFQGALSTIKDNFSQLLGNAFLPFLQNITGVFSKLDTIFSAIKPAVNEIAKNIGTALQNVAPTIGAIVIQFANFLASISPLLPILASVINILTLPFEAAFAVVSKGLQFLSNLILGPVVKGFTFLNNLVTQAVVKVGPFFNVILKVGEAVLLTIGRLTGLTTVFKGIGDKISELGGIGAIFSKSFGAIAAVVSDTAGKIGAVLGPILSFIGGKIAAVVTAVAPFVAALFKIGAAITLVVTGIGPLILGIGFVIDKLGGLSGIGDKIGTLFGAIGTVLGNAGGAIAKGFGIALSGVIDRLKNLQNIASTVGGAIAAGFNLAVTGFDIVKQKVLDVGSTIVDFAKKFSFLGDIAKSVGGVVSDIAGTILSPFAGALKFIGDKISSLLGIASKIPGIGGAFKGLKASLNDVGVGDAIDQLTGKTKAAGDAFGDITSKPGDVTKKLKEMQPEVIDLTQDLGKFILTAGNFGKALNQLAKDAKSGTGGVKGLRDEFAKLGAGILAPLDPFSQAISSADALKAAKESIAPIDKQLADLGRQQTDAQQALKDLQIQRKDIALDTGRAAREEADALERIKSLENQIRDIQQERDQITHDEQNRQRDFQPTLTKFDDDAITANINLVKAKRAVEDAQKAINDAQKAGLASQTATVDLSGLTLDQIRSKLANSRFNLQAQQNKATTTADQKALEAARAKEDLANNVLEATIGVHDAETAITKNAQDKAEFIRNQTIAQREFNEKITDLAVNEAKANRDKEVAILEHNKLLRGEIGLKKDIKDLNKQIADSERGLRDIGLQITNTTKERVKAVEKLAEAELQAKIDAAQALGDTAKVVDLTTQLFNLKKQNSGLDAAANVAAQAAVDLIRSQQSELASLQTAVQTFANKASAASQTGLKDAVLAQLQQSATNPNGISAADALRLAATVLSTAAQGVDVLNKNLAFLSRATGKPIPLNLGADGGIFTQATNMIIGEAGQEVLLPLTRPGRLAHLLNQPGILPPILAALPKLSMASFQAPQITAAPAPSLSMAAGPSFAAKVPAVSDFHERDRERQALAEAIADAIVAKGVTGPSVEIHAPVTVQTPGVDAITERAIVNRIMKEIERRL